LHEIAEQVAGRIGDARDHDAAGARAAALVDQAGGEARLGNHRRNEPAIRHAAQLPLLKARVGYFSLGKQNAGEEQREQESSHGIIVANPDRAGVVLTPARW